MFENITTFNFPTRIVFGCGAVRQLPACLAETGIRKPMILTDPGLRATPVVGTVIGVLTEAGIPHEVFADVHGNPIEDDVIQSAAQYRAAGCDGAIGLGGGSALDVAKAVVAMARHDGDITELDAFNGGVARIAPNLNPIIAIPTTSGTGSEVGRSAVVTVRKLGKKIFIFHPQLLPARAILDPELTVGLPPALTAATGMDAFTHCLESYTCPVFHPICDAIAIHGMELVIRYLERATRDGKDIEARGNMQVAATMGAIAFQKDLGAAHSLAHPLSTEFGLNHGLANALVLPAVMRFNIEVAASHYARVAGLFGVETKRMSEAAAAAMAVAEVEAFIDRLGIQRGLRNHKVTRESFTHLARKAFDDPCHKTNIRASTEDDLLKMYEASW
jgi:4-hydroxybutyrate dehydrogenase